VIEDQIQEDELKDQAEIYGHLSPVEYARLVGIAPQRVYYYIRNKRISVHNCPGCGRKVIKIEEADVIFRPDMGTSEEDQTPKTSDPGQRVQPQGE
jgi:hypothetical protein